MPYFYQQTPHWTRVDSDHPAYYDTVYANTTLVTALADLGAGSDEPVCSSSQPSLMIRMVEALELRDGQRVLEIGTGTGYNAAWLSHRLGEANVFSVDVDADLVATATGRQPVDTDAVPARDTDVLILPTQQPLPWFLTVLRLPVAVTFGYTIDPNATSPARYTFPRPTAPPATSPSPTTPNGTVAETGPQRLWTHVEDAHGQWTAWGQRLVRTVPLTGAPLPLPAPTRSTQHP